MTFNLEQAYAQLLSRLWVKCNMYLKNILDSFSMNLMGSQDDIERDFFSMFMLFCTQLIVDLIQRPRDMS